MSRIQKSWLICVVFTFIIVSLINIDMFNSQFSCFIQTETLTLSLDDLLLPMNNLRISVFLVNFIIGLTDPCTFYLLFFLQAFIL